MLLELERPEMDDFKREKNFGCKRKLSKQDTLKKNFPKIV